MVRPRAASDVFRAVADPTRRRILELLAAGDRNVSELGGHFELSQPSLSQHLAVLRQTETVSAVRVGRNVVYRLEIDALAALDDWLSQVTQFWTERLARLETFLDMEDQ